MRHKKIPVVLLSVVFSAFLMMGCFKKAVKKNVEAPKEEPVAEEQAKEEQPFDINSIVGTDWKDVPMLGSVNFDLDRSDLKQEARTTLQKNAKWLKDISQVEVRVAGHCDDRGTVEYNIALGQKRARAARDYYKSLGIPERRLTTISFGEERPLCTDETEECWAKNRRAETKVRILSLDDAAQQTPGKKDKKSRRSK